MKFIERLKNRFGRNTVDSAPQTDPIKPNFDIRAWQAELREIEAKYPDSPGVRELRAIGLGFSDFVTPEQKAEQQRRWAEMQSQEEEARRTHTSSDRRAS